MGWIFWFWGNRGGTIVPVSVLVGGLLGGIVANSLTVGWPLSGLVGALAGSLLTSGLIVWRALRNREASGEVRYDPQTNSAVVSGENSGTFLFIPVISWSVLAAPAAFMMALSFADYGHQRTLILQGGTPPPGALSSS